MSADLTKVVEIVFGAVDRDTKATIDSIGNSLSTFDAGVQNIAEPVSRFTEGLLKAEAGVAALGAAFVTLATNESSKFGEKMEEIGSLVNATPEQVDRLGATIQAFARESTSNFDQIGQAVYIATSNLGDTSKAMDILGIAEKGAVVGATDLESTTALLTRTMNAYGLVTGDSATNTANAERVMAAMFTTVQNGDINMTMLSENLGKVASSAAAAGVPIETVGAAIAAITGAGVNAEQSMTLLNALLKELLSPSDDLSKALGGLKVTTDGLPAIMERLKQSTGGSADQLYALFSSSEAAKGALILANDSAGKFHTTLGAMKDGVANLNQNFDDFAGGMADSMQKMENSWLSMLQVIGKPNQENFQAVYDAFNALFLSVENAMRGGAFDGVFKFIDDFSDTLSGALESIAKNLPEALNGVDFAGLADSLGGLGDELKSAFGDIFGNIDLGTVEGLRSAIQTTVNVIGNLINVTTEVIKQFEPIFAAIGEAGKQVGGAGDETVKASGKLLGALTVLGEFGTAFGGLLLVINESQTDISNVFNTLAGGARVFSNVMQLAFDAVALAITVGLRETTYAIGGFFDTIGADTLAQKFYDSGNKFNDITQGIKLNLQSNAKDMDDAWGQMANGLSLSSDTSARSINKIGDAAADAAKPVAAIGDTSKASLADVGSSFAAVTPKLVEFSNETKKAADSLAKTIESAPIAAKAVSQVSQSFADGAEAEKAYNRLKEDGYKVSIEYANGLFKVSAAQEEAAKTGKDIKTTTAEISQSFEDGAKAEELYNRLKAEGHQVNIEYANGLFTVHESQVLAKGSALEAGQAAKNAADKAIEGSAEWKRVQEVMIESQKVTNDFQIKLGELANNRYEIVVKASVDLRVAEIEAETSRVNAAFNSINESVSTLTTGSTDLWGLFEKKAGFTGSSQLEEAAKRMEQRLDSELELKQRLTDAIVEQASSMTQKLNSGQPLIQIDGGSLAPELEMIFDKILTYTQTRTTQEGLALLLGVG